MKKGIYSEPNNRLRAWLRARREEKGLKTRELAALLEVAHSKIVRVERGEQMINVVQFVEWCVALQANPREIIGQLWLLEMDEKSATATPSWETDKAAAEPAKPVSYTTRRKAKAGE
jgi:transcriptional regulator with XRE-family HTH domain